MYSVCYILTCDFTRQGLVLVFCDLHECRAVNKLANVLSYVGGRRWWMNQRTFLFGTFGTILVFCVSCTPVVLGAVQIVLTSVSACKTDRIMQCTEMSQSWKLITSVSSAIVTFPLRVFGHKEILKPNRSGSSFVSTLCTTYSISW